MDLGISSTVVGPKVCYNVTTKDRRLWLDEGSLPPHSPQTAYQCSEDPHSVYAFLSSFHSVCMTMKVNIIGENDGMTDYLR